MNIDFKTSKKLPFEITGFIVKKSIYFLTICSAILLPPAQASEHDHNKVDTEMAQASVQRFENKIAIPSVTLTRADGMQVKILDALDNTHPIILNFIFTTCTAICPVTSQVFSEFQGLLTLGERKNINMVSISIDPEQDSPRKLTSYAKRFSSNGTWSHFTSSAHDSELVQRAFGAWRGDKMNHVPQTFLRAANGNNWIRLDGFISPEGLLAEYRKLSK